MLKFIRILSALAVAVFAVAAGATAQDATPAPSYKVVGYYIAWGAYARNYTPQNINGSMLTHINYAFATIKDGEVAMADPLADKANFKKLRKLKKDNPHLRTLISIGGWTGSKEFSNIALTPDTRAKFADSAVVFMRHNGFDGVDIDWEFPVSGGDAGNAMRPEDKQNYTLMFQALREKLDAAGKKNHRTYLLTAAIGNNEGFLKNTEMDKVAGILDWANIMTYDFAGHWNKYAGHVAPLYNDPALQRDGDKFNINAVIDLTMKAGVPPGKLVLGMPFYGYSWKKCGAAQHGQQQDCDGKGRGSWEDGALDFSKIDRELVNKNGFTRYWNDAAKVPYLYNDETGEFVTYDDLDSFDYKIKFLKEKGLAGAMFWEITGDRDYVLQKKLAHDLLGK